MAGKHEGDEVAQQNSVNPFGEDEPLLENITTIDDAPNVGDLNT